MTPRNLSILTLTALFALALAPAASAERSICTTIDRHETTCLEAGSYANGTCDDANGSESSFVSLYRYDGEGGWTSAGASSGCYSYDHVWEGQAQSGSGSGLVVYAYATQDGTMEPIAVVSWQAWESEGPWGGSEGCDVLVSGPTGSEDFHCPAGAPPTVPPVLP